MNRDGKFMNIVYLGSGEFGIDCLDVLAESQHSIRLIVTQPAQPAGRGRKLTATVVSEWAKKHNTAALETADVNEHSAVEKIKAACPDLILVIAFGQKVGETLIRLPPRGAVNVHGSLLPRYRGAAPVNWAIINGEKETGVSIIRLAEKIDSGDIIAQAKTEIGDGENAGALHDRLARLAAPLLVETIDAMESGSSISKKQDDSLATRAPKLKKADGWVDFSEPADILRRKILGLFPWPGASANYLSKKTGKTEQVIFADARVVETADACGLPAGSLDGELNIVCGEKGLKITGIKPAGGTVMKFEAFVNGRQTKSGDMFTKIQK
jgi:methionyl-tRNA formyltransferase